jgi:hypothetical protein
MKSISSHSGAVPMVDCPCLSASMTSGGDAITEFKALREECPALRTILIPDFAVWERAYFELNKDSSGQRPILLTAFKRGYLHRITLPIHRYLMDGDSPKSDLTAQYRKDLQERWFLRPNPLDRHKKSKGFLGRLSELLIAQWIEDNSNLTITGLEATGREHDIVAVSPDGRKKAMEVKFIGTSDSFFEKLLAMKIFGGAYDVPTAADFLLTRIYEASKQLADYPYKKTAIIIIDEMTWCSGFDAALCSDFWGHADLRNPKLKSPNRDWLQFVENLKERYADIESDLAPAIGSLDEIRLFILSADETLREESI